MILFLRIHIRTKEGEGGWRRPPYPPYPLAILIYIYILHNFVIVYLYFVIRVTRENKFLDISVSRVSKYTKWYTSGLPIEK